MTLLDHHNDRSWADEILLENGQPLIITFNPDETGTGTTYDHQGHDDDELQSTRKN